MNESPTEIGLPVPVGSNEAIRIVFVVQGKHDASGTQDEGTVFVLQDEDASIRGLVPFAAALAANQACAGNGAFHLIEACIHGSYFALDAIKEKGIKAGIGSVAGDTANACDRDSEVIPRMCTSHGIHHATQAKTIHSAARMMAVFMV